MLEHEENKWFTFFLSENDTPVALSGSHGERVYNCRKRVSSQGGTIFMEIHNIFAR